MSTGNSGCGLNFEANQEKCMETFDTRLVSLVEDEAKSIIKDRKRAHNLLIEGENYQGLKLLEPTHNSKIDCIYIDPPYNGHGQQKKFVYHNRFVNGKNPSDHSSWISFMSNRLSVAKSLLSDVGIIFISIDDSEMAYLKLLCDRIFGEENFIANLVWISRPAGGNDSRFFAIGHEYILVYARDVKQAKIRRFPQDVEADSRYRFEDKHVLERGRYCLEQLQKGTLSYSQSLDFPIQAPDMAQVYPHPNNIPQNGKWIWRWNQPKVLWGLANDFIEFKRVKDRWMIYAKRYQFVDNKGTRIVRTQPMRGVINGILNTHSKKELVSIFGEAKFNYAKPVKLMQRLLYVATSKDSIVLDFFAGSGTTGQAVSELNREDGGNRQFILITNNEISDKLPNGICHDITYPRLQKTIGDENLKYYRINVSKPESNDSVIIS